MYCILIGLLDICSCAIQTTVCWGDCDLCSSRCGHILLGFKNSVALKSKIWLLTVMEKSGDGTHISPMIMSPACLQGKQHVLLSRKSYINSEAHSAYKLFLNGKSMQHSVLGAQLGLILHHLSSLSVRRDPRFYNFLSSFVLKQHLLGQSNIQAWLWYPNSFLLTKCFQGNTSSKVN